MALQHQYMLKASIIFLGPLLTAAAILAIGWPVVFVFFAVALGSIFLSMRKDETLDWDAPSREDAGSRPGMSSGIETAA